MQPERFDALSRFLAAPHSRRDALRALVGAAVGGVAARPLLLARTAAAAPAEANVCTFTTKAATRSGSISFSTQTHGLVLSGSGRVHLRGLGNSLTVNATQGGKSVFRFKGSMAENGAYTAAWTFGELSKGVRHATLITKDGKHLAGTVDGHALSLQTGGNHPLRYTNGKQAASVKLPSSVRAALKTAGAEARRTVKACRRRSEAAVAHVMTPGDPTYGSPGVNENTTSQEPCIFCLGEAYAAAIGCVAACAGSFGIACGCIAGIPLLFANCHTAGDSLGQGCCPVGCGPSHDILGLAVVYQCCNNNDQCLNSTTGTCCHSGTQPCGNSLCCPSNAPCRSGICCPPSQAVAFNGGNKTCCGPGQSVVNGFCCQGMNQTCGSNAACCSNFCDRGRCDCIGSGDPCQLGPRSCCSGKCNANGKCT